MAKKKSGKSRSKAKESKNDVRHVIADTAAEVVDEVEKAADVVLREINESFNFLSKQVTDTARYAAKTTKAVRDKVTSKETAKQLQGLLKEVEDAGESLLHVIGGSFDSLKDTVLSTAGMKTGSKKKAPSRKKKPAAKKKAPARKKAAKRKKAVARKKTTAKNKTTTRKKAPARKKTATRKKTAARKKTATRRKTTATTRKKATARKRAPARKKTVARKAARRR